MKKIILIFLTIPIYASAQNIEPLKEDLNFYKRTQLDTIYFVRNTDSVYRYHFPSGRIEKEVEVYSKHKIRIVNNYTPYIFRGNTLSSSYIYQDGRITSYKMYQKKLFPYKSFLFSSDGKVIYESSYYGSGRLKYECFYDNETLIKYKECWYKKSGKIKKCW